MNFKNELEERAYHIAVDTLGPNVRIEHNKVIAIERTDAIEVASFVGPPRKEIDLISAKLGCNLSLLISCKDYGASRAAPSDVQEWAAVVRTMNSYSASTSFLGLVICPGGFTKGCEPWATTHNLGLIPPLKGKRLSFNYDVSLQMLRRTLFALPKRLRFPYEDFLSAPGFYDFVFGMISDFEWREVEAAKWGGRYSLLGSGWRSSFGELVSTLMGKTIRGVFSDADSVGLRLSDNLSFTSRSRNIIFGAGVPSLGAPVEPMCFKNLSKEPCSFDFVKNMVLGKVLKTAGDFGNHFEFGLSDDLLLGFHSHTLYVVLARNPPEENLL